MAAIPENPRVNKIKVYCPVHKLGFSAGATPAIECPQNHTIGTDFPNDPVWLYCCDCQHYTPSPADSTAECPACDRPIAKRFLCGECQIFSIESDTPGRRKEFSISSRGVPAPACPGCLNAIVGSPRNHECPDYPHKFVTTRTVCLFCDDALEPPPVFPCSVASIVSDPKRSLRALVFDTETERLRESEEGQYLLIRNSGNARFPIVIPRYSTLSSRQDYQNTYDELFSCDNPVEGEIYVLSPAVVEIAEGGWLLKEAGFIEVKPAESSVSIQESQPQTPACGNCGTRSGPGHVFCRKCGSALWADTVSVHEDTAPDLDGAGENSASDSWTVPATKVDVPPIQITPSYPLKTIVGVVGAIASLGLVITLIAVLSSGGNSIENRLDKAISNGNLIPPARENAYELYLQLKNSGASEQKLRPYRDRILPALTDHPLRMIRDFMVAGSDDPDIAEWQSASQHLSWALDLNPGDATLTSRSLYAHGRVAYLSKDEETALAIWTRAASADRSWPLPENGIGLIHFARKNYGVARTHYQNAIQRDPNWPYPYNNMGTSYYMQKNYAEAKGFYQKASQLAPLWARPHSWLGDIAMREQDYQTAISEFSLALDPNAVGTKNMDLERIRRQLELAQQRSIQF